MTTEEFNSEQNPFLNEDGKQQEITKETVVTSETEIVEGKDSTNLGEALVEESTEDAEQAKELETPIAENAKPEDSEKNQMEVMQGITEMETPVSKVENAAEEKVEEPINTTETENITDNNSEHHTKKEDINGISAENSEESTQEKPLSLSEIITKLENLQKTATADTWNRDSKDFNKYKAIGYAYLHAMEKADKQKWIEEGKPEEDFKFENSQNVQFSELMLSFKKVQEEFHHKQDNLQAKNLEHRHAIIDRLKNLNSNADANTNLFKEIRIIKEQWSAAGQVPKADFKIINNDYFHHLTQFYEILDLKKEYLEQEYAHNLEKREHIIARAKELLTEESVQKALNELQYLHKLWKEEAVPVAEEFREKTWQEFKDISDKIHDRRAELTEQLEAEHAENLAKKNAIIEEIRKLTEPEKEPNHNYWQNSIKKIDALREEFLKTGSVSRKLSNKNWQDFKDILKTFNNNKNIYYKSQKNSQQKNLEEKLKLIQIAKDNNLSEDWETMVSMFKNLQQDWKKIGHVPRSQADKIWAEFREACNVFFDNYRDKSKATGDNWQENFAAKKELLDQLKAVLNEEGSVEKIEEIKNAWNAVGKVPKDKLYLHTDFNKTLREKLKLNNIQEYELKEEGLSEHQITDKARRIKSQISDMEAEISKLENNLGFFSNSSRDNPLLADTYKNIDAKKANLESLKQSLHQIIIGE